MRLRPAAWLDRLGRHVPRGAAQPLLRHDAQPACHPPAALLGPSSPTHRPQQGSYPSYTLGKESQSCIERRGYHRVARGPVPHRIVETPGWPQSDCLLRQEGERAVAGDRCCDVPAPNLLFRQRKRLMRSCRASAAGVFLAASAAASSTSACRASASLDSAWASEPNAAATSSTSALPVSSRYQ